MKRYARVVDGIVVETVDLPNRAELVERYHPDLAAQFVECTGVTVGGAAVRQRMRFDGKMFGAEPAQEPPPAEAVLAASDARAARKLEDVLDALMDKGVLSKCDLPEATAAWLDDRKALRGNIARKHG